MRLWTSSSTWAVVTSLVVACSGEQDRASDAAGLVVADMIGHVPAGYRPWLAGHWADEAREPIPAGLLQVLRGRSGLEVVPDSLLLASKDSSWIVLYMLEPRILGHDSIAVLAGWMGLVGGDGGGAWGIEYDYRLECAPHCRILTEPRGSIWN